LVEKVGEEYWHLNEMDCDDLKKTLREIQGKKPGRVRLSQFYNKGMYSHWDFSEKREYLRSLGVLDETDQKYPYLIIANYAMARPNCLDSSNIYTICCRNDCEDLMAQLEGEIGGATADPHRIAKLVAAMPSDTVEKGRSLPQDMVDRLKEIADRHGGEVPLHGRLFAQWMHHAYPLECPYPHEMGTVNPLTRGEWIKESGHESEKASTEEIMEHIAADSCAITSEGHVKCAGESAEIPWSDNEELLTWRPKPAVTKDPAVSARPQWALVTPVLACVLGAVGLAVAVRRRSRPVGVLALLVVAAFEVGLVDGTLLVIVLCVGCMVVAANIMGSKPRAAGKWESKQEV